jgi:hypothetical protein
MTERGEQYEAYFQAIQNKVCRLCLDQRNDGACGLTERVCAIERTVRSRAISHSWSMPSKMFGVPSLQSIEVRLAGCGDTHSAKRRHKTMAAKSAGQRVRSAVTAREGNTDRPNR